MELQVGDVARVKSGGPKMTLSTWDDKDGKFFCVWFDGNNEKSGWFKTVVLEKDTTDEHFDVS